MMEAIRQQAAAAMAELLETARLRPGDILVIGCSSSEILGEKIGTASSMNAAAAVADGIWPLLEDRGVFLAAQCCEHLNRAIVMERAAAEAYGLDPVNVVPQPKAGGSFATTVWGRMADPVVVETVRAHAGLDIGGTLIGMHLRPVAVPVRLSTRRIGEALLISARTRPKFIGGSRAHYNESQL